MARLTGWNKTANSKKPLYLEYKSTEQTIQEAIEQHETRFSRLGWASIISVFFLLLLHDAFLYYVFKVL
jgi:hypothetical protein